MLKEIMAVRLAILNEEVKEILEEQETIAQRAQELEVRMHQLVGAFEELRLIQREIDLQNLYASGAMAEGASQQEPLLP